MSILVVPGAGIEPARYIIPRDFKSLASTYSAIRAYFREPLLGRENLEAPPGFEPGMEVLQTSALPLGDGAKKNQQVMLIYIVEKEMERETGFEPATSTLARLHSTTELFPRTN